MSLTTRGTKTLMAQSATHTGDSDVSLGPGPEEGPTDLTEDEVYDVLSNARRRAALHYLFQQRNSEDWPTLRELSREVAAWETDTATEDVAAEDRRRIHVAMHQTHLPTMEDHGVVEYDDSEKVVELTDHATDLRVFLEVADHNDIPWSAFYTGLGGLGLGVAAAVAAGVPPFGVLPGVAWIAVVSLGVTLAGVAHQYSTDTVELGGSTRLPRTKH